MVLTSIGAPVDHWAGFGAASEGISLLTPIHRRRDNRSIRLEPTANVHARESANLHSSLGRPSSPRADAR
jgi:hypothetical protein